MTRKKLTLYLLPVLFFSSPLTGKLVPVNQTIGDSNTTITYFPPNYWHDQDCPSYFCAIFPSNTTAFNGTWHSATYRPGGPDLDLVFDFIGQPIIKLSVESLISDGHTKVLLSTYSLFLQMIKGITSPPERKPTLLWMEPLCLHSSTPRPQRKIYCITNPCSRKMVSQTSNTR